MRILANSINAEFHRDILPDENDPVDSVLAAIAYGNDSKTLVQNCLENKLKLDIWMRYDHTVPVSPGLLQKLLDSATKNVSCFLVPDVLHAKIIWWKGYGAYIGSANLTERAWISNLEVGIFIPDPQLENDGLREELEAFFDELKATPEIFPLEQSIIDEQRELQRLRAVQVTPIEEELRKKRSVAGWRGPVSINIKSSMGRRKDNFAREWRDGMGYLQSIAKMAPKFRPKWLNEDVPASWQADQFLHAYYYNQVVDGRRHPVEEFFATHRSDSASATSAALKWWSELLSAPSEEDINCHERAPRIKNLLSESNLLSIGLEEFAEVCQANHSTMDHARRMTLDQLGVSSVDGLDMFGRARAFAQLVLRRRNKKGESILDLIHYVLDGGPVSELPHRLFDATLTSERKVPHFGVNQMAEIAGWARPEKVPPRNGRTSKALRSLGYNVHVY